MRFNPIVIVCSKITAIIAVGMLLVGIGGCSDDEDKNLIVNTITAAPAMIAEGEVAVVEVYVTNRTGQPQDDETVYLSAIPANAGVFSSTAATTNGLGIAAVTFTATQPGTVLIGARVGNNPSITYGGLTIEEADDGQTGSTFGQVNLTVDPTILPADGQSTASIQAEVLDNEGNPVPNTTPVRFTAGEKFNDINGDGIWSENIDELVDDADGDGEWDAMGVIDPIDYTEGGDASAEFTAGFAAGLVHIKVTAGAPERRFFADATISLTSSNPISTIALTPENQRIQVKGTGGIEWARIVAEAFDEHGNPAGEGQNIEFIVMDGPGGGEHINGDPVGPVVVQTNSLGQATATLNAGTVPGTVRIRARAGTVLSSATQVTIRSGPAAHISCDAEDCNVPSWGRVGFNNRILAAVVDQWGNEVADSTSVWFSTEQGLIEGAAETMIVPTLRGKAETFWNSAEPRNDGRVFITVETSGGAVRDTCSFIESGDPVSGTFIEWPDTLTASGDSLSPVIIEILDGNGMFLDTDFPVELHTDFGAIPSGSILDGCNSSTYFGYFNSVVLEQDFSYSNPDNGVGAVATITVNAGGTDGFTATKQVVLKTGKASSATSEVIIQKEIHKGGYVPVEVIIRDEHGNPLGGHRIEIVVQELYHEGLGYLVSGHISGPIQVTDKHGVAAGFIFTADQLNYPCEHDGYITIYDRDPIRGGLLMVEFFTIVCE